MVARVKTVCFVGLDARIVEVEVQTTRGLPAFTLVGLPDKTVTESRERVRSTFHTLGIAYPLKRIVVNFSPADVPKEGSHYDLPVALGLLMQEGVLSQALLDDYIVMGQLSLDGRVLQVPGVLSAALCAKKAGLGLICPQASGGHAAWVEDLNLVAPDTFLALINHLKGHHGLTPPIPGQVAEDPQPITEDWCDIIGQPTAKRVLEIAAVGRHNVTMIGPPGAGKSLLAHRFPALLPPLTPAEALEVTQIHNLSEGCQSLILRPPFRAPHHSASMPALMGGGALARPGEVSLAHKGVLFLDEWPEFSRQALDALRQPLEEKEVRVSRVRAQVRYPADFQLVAALNGCPCGYIDQGSRACSRAPRCGALYQGKISGPLWDRIDLVVYMHPVTLGQKRTEDSTQTLQSRVKEARAFQAYRLKQGDIPLSPKVQEVFQSAAEKLGLSVRGYHRTLRVARTLGDMEKKETLESHHIFEALGYRYRSVH